MNKTTLTFQKMPRLACVWRSTGAAGSPLVCSWRQTTSTQPQAANHQAPELEGGEARLCA